VHDNLITELGKYSTNQVFLLQYTVFWYLWITVEHCDCRHFFRHDIYIMTLSVNFCTTYTGCNLLVFHPHSQWYPVTADVYSDITPTFTTLSLVDFYTTCTM